MATKSRLVIPLLILGVYLSSPRAWSQETSLAAKSCSLESSLRSLESVSPTFIRFFNNTPLPVRTYWLDFQGQRQIYVTLAPGQISSQRTFLTHPWVVTDQEGGCLAIYLRTDSAGPELALISEPLPPSGGCPRPFQNPVVPAGSLGEFCHGTLVVKNEVGELVKAPSPELAEYTHPGVDLRADRGSSIFPLTDGVVVETVSQRVNCTKVANKGNPFCSLGFMVRLKHGRIPGVTPGLANFTIYLHMDGPPTVQLGELVLSGRELGKVGNTGSAQGYHTHFELRHFPGQLLADKSWNLPFNIYGAKDQTKSQLFQTRWEDPQRFLGNPNLARPNSEPVTLDGFGRYQNLPSLPIPFYDPGVCPFEGCVYREWRARSNVPIYQDRKSDAPVIYTVRRGEWVTALTGVVVVTAPGEVEFRKKVRLGETNLSAEPGEVLSLLYYEGEGSYKAWFKGVLLSCWDDWFAPGNNFCSTLKADCSGELENLYFTNLAGEMRRRPETTWWVKIRNRAGQTGWTNQSDNFDNKDALGFLSSYLSFPQEWLLRYRETHMSTLRAQGLSWRKIAREGGIGLHPIHLN